MNTPPSPDRRVDDFIEIKPPDGSSPADAWRLLCEGCSDPWLDEIGALRVDGDCLERSLDIWAVTLIASLKQPARKDTASVVLARLRKLSDAIDAQG